MLTINVNELAQTPQPFITHAHGFEILHLVVTVSILGIVAHVHRSQVKLLLHVYVTADNTSSCCKSIVEVLKAVPCSLINGCEFCKLLFKSSQAMIGITPADF